MGVEEKEDDEEKEYEEEAQAEEVGRTSKRN